MKMEVEEQWRREKRVVDEKERAERKIYLFLGLEIGMKLKAQICVKPQELFRTLNNNYSLTDFTLT